MKSSIFEWVTFAIAILGAVLGVISAISEYRRRLPRIRLSLRWCLLYFGSSDTFVWGLALKIMNVGDTPVRINQIGVEIDGRGFVRVNPIRVEGWGEPKVIESTDACVVRIARKTFSGCPIEKVGRVFVELPCEKKFYTGCVRRYAAALKPGTDDDFKERGLEPSMTIIAPPAANEHDKHSIEENCRAVYYNR